MKKVILTIMLAMAGTNAHAANLITQAKYKVETLYYNIAKLPKPLTNSDGVVVGEITTATYQNDVLTYFTTLSWEILELMRTEQRRVNSSSKEDLLETEIKQPMINPMISQYCAMSGKLYRFRRDKIVVVYAFDASEFGNFSVVLGEDSCRAPL